MTKVYGIKNCDTMKKTLQWLDKHKVKYQFFDYKQHGIDEDILVKACKKLGWELLLNRRGTTWRKLPDPIKNSIDEKSAVKIMLQQPAIIKRPLINHNGQFMVGFSEPQMQQLLR